METALAVVETMTGAELFKPGAIDPVLDRIKAEVRAQPRDISTEAGRKAIASLAFKVAKSKTFLDSLGKAEVEADKKRIKMIDQERSRIWDELEALQKETRKPLTDWEDAEKARVAAHEAALVAIPEGEMYGAKETSEEVKARLHLLSRIIGERDWQEFRGRADQVIMGEVVRMQKVLVAVIAREAERAELERLRASQAEREQKERDERIAREAREKAQREAAEREERMHREAQEREAKAIAEAKAREEAAARQAAEEKRLAAEREARIVAEAAEAKRQADLREKQLREQAEQERLAALERDRIAEERRVAAEKRADADRIAAIESERKRIADEQRKAAEEAAKRELDADHRRKINRSAVEALLLAEITEEQAKAVIVLVAGGRVPAVRIVY